MRGDRVYYDRVVYHVGNNPGCHLEIWRALTLFPGDYLKARALHVIP